MQVHQVPYTTLYVVSSLLTAEAGGWTYDHWRVHELRGDKLLGKLTTEMSCRYQFPRQWIHAIIQCLLSNNWMADMAKRLHLDDLIRVKPPNTKAWANILEVHTFIHRKLT
jgi:hypothetical protein